MNEKEKLIERIKTELTTYPFDIVEGRINSCNYIKLACQRFIDWLDRDDIYFDVDACLKVINFAKKMSHTDGQFAQKPFNFENFQIFAVMGVFGYKYKATNLRVTRTYILSVARKSGKSSLLSIFALYCLFEEQSASCVCAANSAAQASLLFKMAKKYLYTLPPQFTKLFHKYRDSLTFTPTDSQIKVVAADADRLDGLNLNFFVQDETAAAPNSEVWDVLESSQGSRSQPLACSCTTRGFNLNGFYKELEDSALEVLKGHRTDDSIFMQVYELEEGDDYEDERNWIKCQPNYGVTVSKEFMLQQITKMKNNPTQAFSIKTKVFNQWVSSSSGWIPMKYIEGAEEVIDMEEWKGYDITLFGGLDLASDSDLTALTIMWEWNCKKYYKTYNWIPSSCLDSSNPNYQKYKRWADSGKIEICAGNVTDYDMIYDRIMWLSSNFFLYQLGYDRWWSSYLTTKLTEAGINLVPVSMNMASTSGPFKHLQRLILNEEVVIDKSPVTEFCFANAVTKFDWNENIKIVKNSNAQKIDNCYSMMIATAVWLASNCLSDSI